MGPSTAGQNGTVQHWVAVRSDASGHFTAQVVGLPEVHALGATREEAVQQVRILLAEWVASGRLQPVEVPAMNPLLNLPGHLDPNDPVEQEFLAELARLRQQDLERTLAEDNQECSSSSSTPTT